MRRFLVAAIAATALAGCTDANSARHTLAGEGYSNVQITGYRFFTCDKDGWATGFTATGPSGQPVSGTVCKGFLKASTVRMD